MKILKIYMFFLAAIAIVACDAIEDESLREDYFENVGEPISKADLQAAITVTQPIPNSDDKVEGDQYVVINNARPDVAGTWYIQTSTGIRNTNTDHDTIVYTANATYSIYFVARSAHQNVQTDPISVEVTNCFDIWDNYFTGAKDKADKTAKKVWEYWEGPAGLVYYNGMYANWKHFKIEDIHQGKNAWGPITTKEQAGNYTMEFEYAGNKLTIYKPDGSVFKQGGYTYTHDNPDTGVEGELITTVPIMGSETSWTAVGDNNTFWLLMFDGDYMVVAHPVKDWATGDFWDHSSWYSFYKAKKD